MKKVQKPFVMTEEHKKLVEKHFDLINIMVQKNRPYAGMNSSLIDEMTSVAEYRLCLCACEYDPSKGEFGPYAAKSINYAIHNLVKTERGRGMTGLSRMTCSEITENVVMETDENIGVHCGEYSDAELKADLRRILSDTEIALLKLIAAGHKKNKIAEASGRSRDCVYRELNSIKQKLLYMIK